MAEQEEPQDEPPGRPEPEPQDDPAPHEADYDFETGRPIGGYSYTTAEFHNVVQKQILHATYETLAASKMEWALIEPFLRAARDMCRGDFLRSGRVQVHGVTAGEDGEWVDAEEAFIGVSVADQDEGYEWLSQTWWLSDLVLATEDPTQVREAVRAMERSLVKLNEWLEAKDAKGPDEAA